jgi:hypothetical protein
MDTIDGFTLPSASMVMVLLNSALIGEKTRILGKIKARIRSSEMILLILV